MPDLQVRSRTARLPGLKVQSSLVEAAGRTYLRRESEDTWEGRQGCPQYCSVEFWRVRHIKYVIDLIYDFATSTLQRCNAGHASCAKSAVAGRLSVLYIVDECGNSKGAQYASCAEKGLWESANRHKFHCILYISKPKHCLLSSSSISIVLLS